MGGGTMHSERAMDTRATQVSGAHAHARPSPILERAGDTDTGLRKGVGATVTE